MEQSILQGVESSIAAKRVFSEPIEKDGAVVVLAATVRGGGGGGEKGEETKPQRGGGFGFVARPAGAFMLKDGRISWRPAIDVNRVILGGQLVMATALFMLRSVLRSRALAHALRPRLFGRRVRWA